MGTNLPPDIQEHEVFRDISSRHPLVEPVEEHGAQLEPSLFYCLDCPEETSIPLQVVAGVVGRSPVIRSRDSTTLTLGDDVLDGDAGNVLKLMPTDDALVVPPGKEPKIALDFPLVHDGSHGQTLLLPWYRH